MPSTAFATALAFLLWAAPTFALDFDGDGVEDGLDNCSERANPTQDDTDQDGCGNLCDADYANRGIVGIDSFGIFANAFGTMSEEQIHRDPVSGKTVGHRDWGFFVRAWGSAPGPSGTTSGTQACP